MTYSITTADITTPGYKRLRGEFATTAGIDDWGNAMEWFFAVAAIIFHHDANDVPAAWKYHHSPLCDWPDECADVDGSSAAAYLTDGLDAGEWDLYDAYALGTILYRYANVLKSAGKAY